jgi:carbon-monoxide dehydrogenase large subunit
VKEVYEMTPRTSPEIGGMGHSVKRKEDPRFLRGQGNYVDDVVLPDMLYLTSCAALMPTL